VEGALVEEGASAVGRSYTCQIAVGSFSEGGHTSVLDYCGGVFHSEFIVCICNRFSGFGSIYEGRTFLGHTCYIWTCVSAWNKLLLYQVHLYLVLAVFHHLFSSHIDIYPKLVFPGGVLSMVMLTKNTCVQNDVC
jgi:hypothetical protein